MKVMLVFPPLSAQERYGKHTTNLGSLPPLGLCYMAAVLEKAGHTVKITDCPVNGFTLEDVKKDIAEFSQDWVGLSAITSLVARASELCAMIRKDFPNIKILVGGSHATVMPEETLALSGADIVISGECEDVLVDIIEHPERFPKIVRCAPVRDLDSLPFPARHLLDMSKYTSLPNNYKRSPNVFQVFATRGCPYVCTFCASANGKFRQRSVKNVISEINLLIANYGIKEIVFWDDIFTLNKQWVHDFCDTLIKEQIDIAWSCETRLDLIDEPLVKKMKQAGCWNMFFGIESGNQELLDNIRKKTTLELIRKGVRLVKGAGIEVRGSFMFGLPGETLEMAHKTIDFAIELDPDYAQFSLTTPFPGTELSKTYEQFGVLNKDFKQYNVWMPVFLPSGYSTIEELQNVHRLAFRRFYLRPRYIIKKIMKIRNFGDLRRNIAGFKFLAGFTN